MFSLWLIAMICMPLLLTLVYNPAPSVSIVWDFGNLCGFAATVIMALLFWYSSKPKSFPVFDGKYFISLHRHLGYLSVLLVFIHIGIALIYEPLTIEYLTLASPYYMQSGVVATCLIIGVIYTATSKARKILWSNYRTFKFFHYVFSVVILVLTLFHMIYSKFYINNLSKQIFWALTITFACIVPLSYRINKKNRMRAKIKRTKSSSQQSRMTFILVGSAIIIIFLFISIFKNIVETV